MQISYSKHYLFWHNAYIFFDIIIIVVVTFLHNILHSQIFVLTSLAKDDWPFEYNHWSSLVVVEKCYNQTSLHILECRLGGILSTYDALENFPHNLYRIEFWMMRRRPNNCVSRFFLQDDNNRLYLFLNKTPDLSPQHWLHIILVCWNVFQIAVLDELLVFPRHFWCL